jgi:hypothetical protein
VLRRPKYSKIEVVASKEEEKYTKRFWKLFLLLSSGKLM